MNRYASEQLMTVEEAERLSRLHTDRDPCSDRRSTWAWQTVSGALAQFVSEEQIEQMMRATRQK